MPETLRLLTLNLQHSARPKEVPPQVVEVVAALGVDLVAFTEWMPSSTTNMLKEELAAIGLTEVLISEELAPDDERQNHVLLASRWPVVKGDLPPPPDAAPNALHVRLPSLDLDVLALRVPSYGSPIKAKQKSSEERAAKRRESLEAQRLWMDWLLEAGRAKVTGRCVLIGDFNSEVDDRERWRCADRLRTLVNEGWVHAVPTEGSSYARLSGKPRKLDYAFVSPSLSVASSAYHTGAGGHRIMGRKIVDGALTDHAAFVLTVRVSS